MCNRSKENQIERSEDFLVHHYPLSGGMRACVYFLLVFWLWEPQIPMYFWVNPWLDEKYIPLDSDVIGYLEDLVELSQASLCKTQPWFESRPQQRTCVMHIFAKSKDTDNWHVFYAKL